MHEHLEDVTVERPEPGKAVAVFSGEHDLSERDQIERLLRELVAENELVVVDLSQAIFVDSTTMHVLVGADMEARRRGSRLRLQLGTEALVARAIELTRLDTRLDVARSREEALAGPTTEP